MKWALKPTDILFIVFLLTLIQSWFSIVVLLYVLSELEGLIEGIL